MTSSPGAISGLGKTIWKNSSTVALLFLAIKGLAFLKDPIVAAVYGASSRSDSFYVAFGTANLIYAVSLGGLSASFIPVFTSKRLQLGEEGAWGFFYSFVFVMSAGFLVVAILLGIFAHPVIHAIAPELGQQAASLAIQMFRILLPLPLLTAVVVICTSLLNCYEKFVLPASVLLVGNVLGTVLLIGLIPAVGVKAAAIATVCGIALQAILGAVLVVRVGRSVRLVFRPLDRGLLAALELALPGVLAEGLTNVNYVMIVYMSTTLGAGTFSSLHYGSKVQQVFLDVFIAAIGMVIFPYLATSAMRNSGADLNRLLSLILRLLVAVLLPISVGIVILRVPLVQLIYQRRAFDLTAVQQTSGALGLLALSLVPLGVKDTSVKTFYALHDGFTPLGAIAIAVAVNLVLNVVLTRVMGGLGLMLAFSLSSTLMAVVLLLLLRRRKVVHFERSFWQFVGKTTAACIIMGGVLLVASTAFEVGQAPSTLTVLVKLSVIVLVGVTAYIGALVLLRLDELRMFVPSIRRWQQIALRKGK